MSNQTTAAPVVTEQQLTELGQRLGEAMSQLQAQVTTAESCTGGGVAEVITRIPGSSAWFEAGYVTYSNTQKTRQLGVPEQLLSSVGAVSAEVVETMASGARQRSGARFAIAVSGVAGPGGGTPQKPVGTVWFSWADGEQLYSRCQHFTGDRQQIRQQSVVFAISGILALSQGKKI